MIIFYSVGVDMGMCLSLCVKYALNELNVEGELLSITLGQSTSK